MLLLAVSVGDGQNCGAVAGSADELIPSHWELSTVILPSESRVTAYFLFLLAPGLVAGRPARWAYMSRRRQVRAWFLPMCFALCGWGMTTLASCGGGGTSASAGGSATVYAGTVDLVITSSSGQTELPIQLTITQ
jgi:hypothetical protein